VSIARIRQVIGEHLGRVLTPEIACALEMAANPLVRTSEPPAWQGLTPELLRELLLGNEDAVQFYLHVARWSHVYDDLVDADKPVSQEALHVFVWRMLFDIPLNPFFDQHQATLRPLLMTGILNWIAANEMEQSGCLEELRVAHVIRYSVSDILLASMVLVGGIEHARANARRSRLMMQDETWLHYSTEKGTCHEGN
jgi:predicted XRE-type DNA-binding protein